MSGETGSVQRSFRLSRRTSDLLDAAAESTGESRNALADRLLGEAVRTERHPLIRFRTGAAGRREPQLVGTRLLVRQVIATVRNHDGNLDDAAAYLDVPTRFVRAALSYYADYTGEVDADATWAARVEADERARWEREQAALA
jgi:uncharacterized protein (DUF433 family)